MLSRPSSMTLYQPIMPFKWRPFDLYNDIHLNCLNGENACETTVKSNNVRCQSDNCDYLMLLGNLKSRRHSSSRGSSSDNSSCASQSTTSHFVADIESMNQSTESFDYCRKLNDQYSNSLSNHDKLRCAVHRPPNQPSRCQTVPCCTCRNSANIYYCCGSDCRKSARIRATIYNNNSNDGSSSGSGNGNGVHTIFPFERVVVDHLRQCEHTNLANNANKNYSNGDNLDSWTSADSSKSMADKSARRYVEGDVNIHYKTPVRYEIKDPISDSELVHRQEQMKKLYQEERRRKYLQELQDLNNRRHTDNFTPSQKSPISLNRYDDFGTIYDFAPKSPNFPRTLGRALYNFQGQTSRELSFKKGEIIYIRREIDKNWYEGEFNGNIGLLPANYVEIVSKDGVRCPVRKPSEGQARAKFNFQAQSAIELSLHKGELVVLTRRVDDNWFEGRIANRKGIFPVSYVEVLTDIGSDAPAVPCKPIGAPAAHSLINSPRSNYATDVTTTTNVISNGLNSPIVRETAKEKTEVLHVDTNSEPIPYRAIYKYRPQNSDELELQEGDTVYVLEKCDDGWFVGTSQRTGFFGTFPGNYVERI